MSGTALVAAVLGLSALIVVHELGHLVAARLAGIGVERVSLFLGPALVRLRRKDCEWCLGAVPVGGYVRLRGGLRPSTDVLEWELRKIPEIVRRRLLEELERARTVGEAERAIVGLRQAASELPEQARLSASAVLDRLAEASGPDSWWLASPARRAFVLCAGPLANLAVAFLLLVAAFASGGASRPTTTIGAVSLASPAAQAGLAPGETILELDGRSFGFEQGPALLEAFASSRGERRLLVLPVAGAARTVTLPACRPTDSGACLYGIDFERMPVRYSLAASARRALALLREGTWATIVLLLDPVRAGDELTGPVGIVSVSASTVASGAASFVGVLGAISLGLALFNLLPLPPLDGGGLLTLALERARGRRLRPQTERAWLLLGLTFVACLLALGLGNDLARLR